MKATSKKRAKIAISKISALIALQCTNCSKWYNDTIEYKNFARSAQLAGFYRNDTACPHCGEVDNVTVDLRSDKKH
jgi:hypothetical protein